MKNYTTEIYQTEAGTWEMIIHDGETVRTISSNKCKEDVEEAFEILSKTDFLI